MDYKKIKNLMKISIQEISSESGITTTMVHGYLTSIKEVKIERVIKIEGAIESIARQRIEECLKLMEGRDE
jgi:predicted transcriptional regulator